MNETPKVNGRTHTFPSAHHGHFEEESCYFMKESDIKWYIKSATDNGCMKQLSTQKNSDYHYKESNKLNKLLLKPSIIPNGRFQSQNSGFDIKKLYPELSSKLGLTDSSSSEKSNKVTPCKKLPKTKLSTNSSIENNIQSIYKYNMCCEAEKKGLLPKADVKNVKSEVMDISCIKDTKLTDASIFNERKQVHLKNKKNSIKARPSNFSHKSKLLQTEKKEVKHVPDSLQNQFKSERPFNDIGLISNRSSSGHESVTSNVYSLSTNYKSPSVIKVYPRSTVLPLPKYMLPSLRVNQLNQNNYAYKSDLFPLGFESSEYETSDDDALDSYFSSPECLSKQENTNELNNLYIKNAKFSNEISRQQLLSRKARMEMNELNFRRRWALMRTNLEATRAATRCVKTDVKNLSDDACPMFNRKSSENRRPLKSKLCIYTGEGEKMCIRKALPGSRHCLRHITYNVDQQLFSQCSARKEDGTLCRTPTFDFLHDPPLCEEHCSDRFVRSSPLENVDKLKKPKKKSKMPILSRGKRYKKRRHSFESSIIPSTRVRPPINSPANCFGLVEPPSPLTSSNLFSACSDDNDDTEFENDFKEIEEVIPLEAASRLLESKDFQDVLNKLPDPDLSQIFYTAEPRQLPSMEEEDERKVKVISSIGRPPKATVIHKEPEASITLGESAISEISGCKVMDSIISFNQHELNAISQVLSSMVNDHTLNLDSFAHVEEVVGKDVPLSPPILEASTSSGNYSEDSNSESSKILAIRDSISPPQECTTIHCAPILQATNLKVSPPTLQPL